MVICTPYNTTSSNTQASGSESLQTPTSVSSVPGGPSKNQRTLIHGHLVFDRNLEQDSYSPPSRLNQLDPSLFLY